MPEKSLWGIMSAKIITAFLIAFIAAQSALAQEFTIDFDGNAAKSIKEVLDLRSVKKSAGKVQVEVVSDNGVVEQVVPGLDRYGVKHYTFTPGKNHAMIRYTCPGPIGQWYTWYLKLTPPIGKPQEAGHNHASADILGSRACKINTKKPCKPEPAVKYTYFIDGSVWQPITSAAGMVTSPQLGPNSEFKLSVDIPKYATQLTTDVEFSGTCVDSRTDYMDIVVPGLKELPQSPLYISAGANGGVNMLHPFNHYATTTTVNTLVNLAGRWSTEHPGANKLVYNDMSLKSGGLFDVHGNWSGSHSNHSFGTAIDVSKRCINKTNRAAFIRLIDEFGFSILSEGDAGTEQNHYHIQHKKEIDRLRAVPGFPITDTGGMTGVPDYADESYANNGGGIDVVPPPPLKAVSSCIALIKANPSPTFKCNVAQNPDGTLGDGLKESYCKCISLYEIVDGVRTLKVESGNTEPVGCN